MLKPKKLNLNDVWKLYLLLKPALDGREFEEILIDEVEQLMRRSKSGTLFECLDILYDNIIREEVAGPDAIILFMAGLVNTDFYSFVEFIKDV